MLDYSEMAATHANYWINHKPEEEDALNNFVGEWQISDHNLIPTGVRNFLMERFPRKERLTQIPLKDVNVALNEAWEGPGSMAKLVLLTEQMRQARVQPENPRVKITENTDIYSLAAQAEGDHLYGD
jgi:hypothetical protein